jgi:hypothetical protein
VGEPLYVPEPGLEAVYARFAETWDVGEFENNIKEYWTVPGRAGYRKIRWGTPGDWTRCYRHLSKPNKPLGPERAKRICAQWHHEVTGIWPGDHRNK